MTTARALLSYVLCEAREMLDRSPEQIGAAVGVSGRTIRRLEASEHVVQPRQTTLRTVATFYGLDANFITELAAWEDGDEALLRRMREQAGSRGLDFAGRPDEPEQLAKLLSRGATRSNGSHGAWTTMSAGPGSGKSHVWALLAQGTKGTPWASGLNEDEDELIILVEAFVQLDRRRRRLALTLIDELRNAREAERAQG